MKFFIFTDIIRCLLYENSHSFGYALYHLCDLTAQRNSFGGDYCDMTHSDKSLQPCTFKRTRLVNQAHNEVNGWFVVIMELLTLKVLNF